MMQATYQWYAVRTAPRKEFAVASALAAKGYEEFLPTLKKLAVWSDRVRETAAPLFTGYVFCRFDPSQRMPVLQTLGVRSVVAASGIPVAIPACEVEDLRAAMRHGLLMEPWDRVERGNPVIVTTGPLRGVRGYFIGQGARGRLILSVCLIQRSVAVEINGSVVEPVPPAILPNLVP